MATQRRIVRSDQQIITLEKAFENYIAEKRAENSSPETIRSSIESFKRWYGFLDEEGYFLNIKDVDEFYVTKFSSYLLQEELSTIYTDS